MTKLFGVPISITSAPQALALVTHWLRQWRILNTEYRILNKKSNSPHSEFSIQNSVLFPKLILTPNPEIIVAAQSDPGLMKALQEADLSIPDGVGVSWALRLPSRLSGLDLMESLMSELPRTLPWGLSLRESPWKVLLLGGRPGVAQAAAAKLQRNLKSEILNLKFKTLSGPQNISAISKSENDRLIAQINSFQPDLLFVAFGHPKQEKWLSANRCRLNAGVAMGVGGALDQIADPSLRPPPYINSIGLGWLYRLLRQPWRWRRQLALIKFVGMVFRQKLQFFIV